LYNWVLKKKKGKEKRITPRKLLKVKKQFRKSKDAYLDLKSQMDDDVGVVPTILSVKNICEENNAAMNRLHTVTISKFNKVLRNQKEQKNNSEIFRQNNWKIRVNEVMMKIEECKKEQKRIESHFLSKIAKMEKKLTEKQQQLSKQLIMIQEEQKNNTTQFITQMDEMIQEQ